MQPSSSASAAVQAALSGHREALSAAFVTVPCLEVQLEAW